MKFLYDLGLHVLTVGAFCRKRSRTHFKERLGMGFPKIEKKGRPLIWIHAVSVGETKAIAPLVKKLKASPNNPLILFSNVTSTGHEEALRVVPEADWHVFLPFDLSYRIRPLVKQVAPDLVLISETDFWHHFEAAAKEVGAPVILVNGKVSETSFNRFLRLPTFSKLVLNPIDLFCVQGKLYAERFAKIGIPREKIIITGNVKLDGLAAENVREEWKQKFGIADNDLVLTCGSTHDPEEKILLRALKELWEKFPQLKVLLVPRHPERFEAVSKIIEHEEIPCIRYSEGIPFGNHKLMLVDAMGVLRQCYQVSDVAFVGGSLTPKVGGHNILEPAFYGVPVVYGPFMDAQPDFVDLMRAYRAGVQVTVETLAPALERLLKHPHKRKELAKSGLKLVQEAKGAIDTTYQAINRYLSLAKK